MSKKVVVSLKGIFEATGNPVNVIGFEDETVILDTSIHPSAQNMEKSELPQVVKFAAADRCKHVKTGGIYIVICIAVAQDNPSEKFVVYMSENPERPVNVWVRHITSMQDGRFVHAPIE